MTLKNIAVFIAEDEPLIAIELTLAVEAACGQIVGPAASLKAADELIDASTPGVALLDLNLIGGDTLNLATGFIERGIPVVFYTGVSLPDEFQERYPDVPIYTKPTMSETLIKAIRGEWDKAAA